MSKSNYYFILMVLLLSFSVGQSMAQGSRYSGSYVKSNTIKYSGKSNFTIEGVEILGNGVHAIELSNCENVVIKNSKLSSTNSPSRMGIYLYNCRNVTIEDCTFDNVRSALVASTSTGVKFEHNDVKNVVGTLYTSGDTGSMVQFIKVSGANNSISYNACENFSGVSYPEDLVNIYASNGTASSPIMIKGNWIRGGGPSISGGGINLGDYGGSYQVAEDNILVDVGQYGIGISGGNNMTLRNNKVYGKQQKFTNVGMVVTNWYEKEAGASFNITASNNRINYTHADGYANVWWIYDPKGIVVGKESNVYDKSLSASILPDKILGRAGNNSNNNNNNGGGSVTPEVPEKPEVPETPTTPEKPEVTPPTGGGNGDDTGKGPENNTDGEVQDPSITIYLDNFNRICVNAQGRVLRTANVSVFAPNGSRLHTQPLVGYHTVIRRRAPQGVYDVRVKNGNKQKNQQIIVK